MVMKCYVVFKGRKPRLYHTWAKCNEQIYGFPGNLYQGYKSDDEAKEALAKYMQYQNQAEAIGKPVVKAVKQDKWNNVLQGLCHSCFGSSCFSPGYDNLYQVRLS